MNKKMYFLLLVLLLVGCSKIPSEETTKEKSDKSIESTTIDYTEAEYILETTMDDYYEQIYDPLTLTVNDRVANMIATDVSVQDIEGSIIVDIQFSSKKLTITGEFVKLNSVDPSYMNTILFIPDEASLQNFPIHNMYEHEIRLVIANESDVNKFQGLNHGKAF